MPRLTRKSDLLARFEESVRLSGWSILYLSRDQHPARYQIFRDGMTVTVRVYIWNISHGGKGRSPDEYRIQVTGFSHFTIEPNSKTIILGWWDDVGVFGGWDVRQHLAPLGASPSMQISQPTLRKALLTGFAPYRNARGETAIGIRPDFMGTYLAFLEDIHDSGQIPGEAALLSKLSDDPDGVNENEIADAVAKVRQHAIVTTTRALRALDFSKRVLSAYGHRCAMCSVQLRLIDGAHILPVAHAESTDATSNGVALCALHHRAYDRGLVTFAGDSTVHINKSMIATLRASDKIEGFKDFKSNLRPFIHVPADKKDRPSKKIVAVANDLRGWRLD